MELSEWPFTAFVRDHRPLESLLGQWIRPIETRIDALGTTFDVDMFISDELEIEIVKVRIAAPRLGGTRPATVRPPANVRTPGGGHVFAARHQIAIEVIGNPVFLSYWPSHSDDLAPVDASSWPSAGLAAENRREVWRLATVDWEAHSDTWGLYTYVDLTAEEEKGSLTLFSGQLE